MVYRRNLDTEYDNCIYINHPKTLILNSKKEIDLFDLRCSKSECLKSIFSIENQDLCTYYNVAPNETIVCCSPSIRDHVRRFLVYNHFNVSSRKTLLELERLHVHRIKSSGVGYSWWKSPSLQDNALHE